MSSDVNRADSKSILDRTAKAARLVADARREKEISVVSFAAALLVTIGARRSKAILASFDRRANPEKVYSYLKHFCPTDGYEPPELMPSAELDSALKTYLLPFTEGKMSAEDALAAHLTKHSQNDALHHFVESPNMMSYQPKTTRQWLQALARPFQERFRLGRSDYCPRSDGTTGFVGGDPPEASAANIKVKHDPALDCDFYHRSPLADVEEEYGELAARVLTVATLAEMKLVAAGPATVHEIAFCVSRDALLNVHRYFGLVRREVETLLEAKYVELPHESTTVRLNSTVLVMPDFLDEFLMYLRDADPITEEDLKNV